MFASMDKVKEIKKHYSRGRTILYDNVPDDVWMKIQQHVLLIKEKTHRGKVGMSQAITKLIRKS
jgi:hypothetical protein